MTRSSRSPRSSKSTRASKCGTRPYSRRGMVIALVLIVLAIVACTIGALITLSHGEIWQMSRTGDLMKAVYACKAGYEDALSRINSGAWEDRFFRNGPESEAGVEFGDCVYDLYMLDTPDEPRSADIYVLGRSGNSAKAMFFRVKYEENIFDEICFAKPVFVMYMDNEKFPGSSGDALALSKKMNELESEREKNELAKNRLLKAISVVEEAGALFSRLSLAGAGDVLSDPISFTSSSPVARSEERSRNRPESLSEAAKKILEGSYTAAPDRLPRDQVEAVVRDWYRKYLLREPEQVGFDDWLKRYFEDGWSLERMERELIASPEATEVRRVGHAVVTPEGTPLPW
jgi:hypothetical protein